MSTIGDAARCSPSQPEGRERRNVRVIPIYKVDSN